MTWTFTRLRVLLVMAIFLSWSFLPTAWGQFGSPKFQEWQRKTQEAQKADGEGNAGKAEILYTEALRLSEKLGSVDRQWGKIALASSRKMLARFFTARGRSSEAEVLYKSQLATVESDLGSSHPGVAACLEDLAALYASQKRFAEADPLYVRAINIREQNPQRDRATLAATMRKYAEALRAINNESLAAFYDRRSAELSSSGANAQVKPPKQADASASTPPETSGGQTKKPIPLAYQSAVNALLPTTDGKAVISGSKQWVAWGPNAQKREGSALKYWSLPEGQLIGQWKVRDMPNSVNALAITPDGKWFAAGLESGDIEIRFLPEGTVTKTIKGRAGKIRALAMAPDGKRLVSGHEEGGRIWSLPDGAEVGALEGYISTIYSLAIDGSAGRVISGKGGGQVEIWSLVDGKVLKTLTKEEDPVRALALSPDSKVLATGSDAVKLWALDEGRLLARLACRDNWVYGLAISGDGKKVAYSCQGFRGQTSITVASIPEGKELATFDAGRKVNSLAFTPDGKWLISGLASGAIILWDTQSWSATRYLSDPELAP